MNIQNYDIYTYQNLQRFLKVRTTNKDIYEFNSYTIHLSQYEWIEAYLEMLMPISFVKNNDIEIIDLNAKCGANFIDETANSKLEICCFACEKEQMQKKYYDLLTIVFKDQMNQSLESFDSDNSLLDTYRHISSKENIFCILALKRLEGVSVLFNFSCPNSDSDLWFDIIKKMMYSVKLVNFDV